MKLICHAAGIRRFRSTCIFVALALALALVAPLGAFAQSADARPCPAKSDAKPDPEIDQSFHLANITQQNELTDIQTDLRNMITRAKVYAVPSQNAISIHGTAEEIEVAQKMIADLDRPKKVYRLTFTITDMDAGKRIGTQTFALIAASGERSIFKQGGRVPIVTGKFDADSSSANTQVQYQDVGLSIEATVNGLADGAGLRSKVEQSSLTEEKSGVGPQDPIVHQTLLEGTSTLVLGKPLVLGSIDIPATTRKQEIAVVADLVK